MSVRLALLGAAIVSSTAAMAGETAPAPASWTVAFSADAVYANGDETDDATGAETDEIARTVAKSVICSSLVKAAMFGADANWGRVLCAIGYIGAPVDVHKVDVAFRSAAGTVSVCVDGAGIPFSEEEAKKVLLEKEIEILVDLKSGDEGATAWGCDLTYDYVKINGDYRT